MRVTVSLKFHREDINIERRRRFAGKSAYFIAAYNLEARKITTNDTQCCVIREAIQREEKFSRVCDMATVVRESTITSRLGVQFNFMQRLARLLARDILITFN